MAEQIFWLRILSFVRKSYGKFDPIRLLCHLFANDNVNNMHLTYVN